MKTPPLKSSLNCALAACLVMVTGGAARGAEPTAARDPTQPPAQFSGDQRGSQPVCRSYQQLQTGSSTRSGDRGQQPERLLHAPRQQLPSPSQRRESM